jgi:hypothetical protein
VHLSPLWTHYVHVFNLWSFIVLQSLWCLRLTVPLSSCITWGNLPLCTSNNILKSLMLVNYSSVTCEIPWCPFVTCVSPWCPCESYCKSVVSECDPSESEVSVYHRGESKVSCVTCVISWCPFVTYVSPWCSYFTCEGSWCPCVTYVIQRYLVCHIVSPRWPSVTCVSPWCSYFTCEGSWCPCVTYVIQRYLVCHIVSPRWPSVTCVSPWCPCVTNVNPWCPCVNCRRP